MTHMIVPITQFRNNIFKMLQKVDSGEEIVVIKKDSNRKYKIIPIEDKPKKDIVAIAKEMGEIGFKAPSLDKMKKIFESRYD